MSWDGAATQENTASKSATKTKKCKKNKNKKQQQQKPIQNTSNQIQTYNVNNIDDDIKCLFYLIGIEYCIFFSKMLYSCIQPLQNV